MNMLAIDGHSYGAHSTVRRYKPVEPKDHIKENVRRMRKIQKDSRAKQEEQLQPVKALWKSSKVDGVQSRVKEELNREPPVPRPHSANFLRAHSRTGYVPASKPVRPSSAEPPPEKLTVPRAESALSVNMKRNDRDFIKLNGYRARSAAMRRSPSLSMLDDLKKQREEGEKAYIRGKTPTYLIKRQEHWKREEEERIANLPDPDLPPGHKMMPDDERRATLQKLKETHAAFLKELNSLPVRTDTVRLKTTKERLDRKIAEVDEAIKIFSRRKVFVKID